MERSTISTPPTTTGSPTGNAKVEAKRKSVDSTRVPSGIRIGVRRRGCSGYSYTVNYYFDPSKTNDDAVTKLEAKKEEAERKNPIHASPTDRNEKTGATTTNTPKGWTGWEEDSVVEQGGLKVVVASDALFYVIGTVMDYIVTNVEEKFIFRNPNKKYSCGCEESFMPYDSEDLEED